MENLLLDQNAFFGWLGIFVSKFGATTVCHGSVILHGRMPYAVRFHGSQHCSDGSQRLSTIHLCNIRTDGRITRTVATVSVHCAD
jgi:hypothetical protein